eukprot:TRINITY_DN16940_c0_g1_i2.p1 TRINITY_DN16940_c0_g1~~TRINITY_DN16940_c0_g1_i2.p1  ORF type:complete len:1118 (+),score=74.00 TRINITY_DN16940_c0_g1_i2:136-3489(+)
MGAGQTGPPRPRQAAGDELPRGPRAYPDPRYDRQASAASTPTSSFRRRVEAPNVQPQYATPPTYPTPTGGSAPLVVQLPPESKPPGSFTPSQQSPRHGAAQGEFDWQFGSTLQYDLAFDRSQLSALHSPVREGHWLPHQGAITATQESATVFSGMPLAAAASGSSQPPMSRAPLPRPPTAPPPRSSGPRGSRHAAVLSPTREGEPPWLPGGGAGPSTAAARPGQAEDRGWGWGRRPDDPPSRPSSHYVSDDSTAWRNSPPLNSTQLQFSAKDAAGAPSLALLRHPSVSDKGTEEAVEGSPTTLPRQSGLSPMEKGSSAAVARHAGRAPSPPSLSPRDDPETVSMGSRGQSELSECSRTESAARRPRPTTEGKKLSWTKGKLLGSGTFGKVYQAFDNSTGRMLAVKEVIITGQNVIKELTKELEVFKKVKHPFIVRYEGLDRVKTSAFILMEYIAGGTIAAMVKQLGRVPEQAAARWTWQIAEGVAYLHKKGIVHRDLKGANILLATEGTIRLADFGCAKEIVQDGATSSINMSGCTTVRGTPYWMAPEVITGRGHGTPADVWSIGCTVLEMVTGKPPHSDINQMSAMCKIASGELPKFDIGENATLLVEACLRVTPAERPKAADLKQFAWLENSRVDCTEASEQGSADVEREPSDAACSPRPPGLRDRASPTSPRPVPGAHLEARRSVSREASISLLHDDLNGVSRSGTVSDAARSLTGSSHCSSTAGRSQSSGSSAPRCRSSLHQRTARPPSVASTSAERSEDPELLPGRSASPPSVDDGQKNRLSDDTALPRSAPTEQLHRRHSGQGGSSRDLDDKVGHRNRDDSERDAREGDYRDREPRGRGHDHGRRDRERRGRDNRSRDNRSRDNRSRDGREKEGLGHRELERRERSSEVRRIRSSGKDGRAEVQRQHEKRRESSKSRSGSEERPEGSDPRRRSTTEPSEEGAVNGVSLERRPRPESPVSMLQVCRDDNAGRSSAGETASTLPVGDDDAREEGTARAAQARSMRQRPPQDAPGRPVPERPCSSPPGGRPLPAPQPAAHSGSPGSAGATNGGYDSDGVESALTGVSSTSGNPSRSRTFRFKVRRRHGRPVASPGDEADDDDEHDLARRTQTAA